MVGIFLLLSGGSLGAVVTTVTPVKATAIDSLEKSTTSVGIDVYDILNGRSSALRQSSVSSSSCDFSDLSSFITKHSTDTINSLSQNIVIPRPIGIASFPLEGTEINDILIGTNGPDLIIGGDGDDAIQGREGSDILCGGAGDDDIQGGTSPDILFGYQGNDFLAGGFEDDYLNGGDGNDKIYAHAGDDILQGGTGTDYFDCSDGLDVVLDYNPSEGDTVTTDCEDVT